MALAHAQIVPTTVTDEVQIDAWSKDADITIRLVQAIATACKAEPSLNVWYNSELGERRLLSRVDVGIAVDLEGGLIVPVLRNVGERDRRIYDLDSIACGRTPQHGLFRRRNYAAPR